MPTTPSRTTRTAFSEEDDEHITRYLAKYNPDGNNRRGNGLWQRIVDNPKKFPWGSRHTTQSWRARYVKRSEKFDELVQARIREKTNQADDAAVPRAGPSQLSTRVKANKIRANDSSSKRQNPNNREEELASSDRPLKKRKRVVDTEGDGNNASVAEVSKPASDGEPPTEQIASARHTPASPNAGPASESIPSQDTTSHTAANPTLSPEITNSATKLSAVSSMSSQPELIIPAESINSRAASDSESDNEDDEDEVNKLVSSPPRMSMSSEDHPPESSPSSSPPKLAIQPPSLTTSPEKTNGVMDTNASMISMPSLVNESDLQLEDTTIVSGIQATSTPPPAAGSRTRQSLPASSHKDNLPGTNLPGLALNAQARVPSPDVFGSPSARSPAHLERQPRREIPPGTNAEPARNFLSRHLHSEVDPFTDFGSPELRTSRSPEKRQPKKPLRRETGPFNAAHSDPDGKPRFYANGERIGNVYDSPGVHSSSGIPKKEPDPNWPPKRSNRRRESAIRSTPGLPRTPARPSTSAKPMATPLVVASRPRPLAAARTPQIEDAPIATSSKVRSEDLPLANKSVDRRAILQSFLFVEMPSPSPERDAVEVNTQEAERSVVEVDTQEAERSVVEVNTQEIERSAAKVNAKEAEQIGQDLEPSSLDMDTMREQLPLQSPSPAKSIPPASAKAVQVLSRIQGLDKSHSRRLSGPFQPPPTSFQPPMPSEGYESSSESAASEDEKTHASETEVLSFPEFVQGTSEAASEKTLPQQRHPARPVSPDDTSSEALLRGIDTSRARSRLSFASSTFRRPPRESSFSFNKLRSRPSLPANFSIQQFKRGAQTPPQDAEEEPSDLNLSEDQVQIALATGIDYLTEQISLNHGFQPFVARRTLAVTGDFGKTDEVMRKMREAAQKVLDEETAPEKKQRGSSRSLSRDHTTTRILDGLDDPPPSSGQGHRRNISRRHYSRRSSLGLEYTPDEVKSNHASSSSSAS